MCIRDRFDANYSTNPSFDGGTLLHTLKKEVQKEYPNVYFVGENFEYSNNSNEDYYFASDSMFNFVISRYLSLIHI